VINVSREDQSVESKLVEESVTTLIIAKLFSQFLRVDSVEIHQKDETNSTAETLTGTTSNALDAEVSAVSVTVFQDSSHSASDTSIARVNQAVD
jgi:acid phosphatase family membrane protein YuiD